ncbi:extracellular solute-binding protein [Paenibacillus eucommiae]|uniref:Aldouronate transport system substrate-binding protein n=1 Tax=Paenibacillus eucommiae TaxID=1355755 RepID=A0ABS4JAY3_9BACL|nr:extracellular solute-binding protein [Paenibacillus eucommiae]MBP1997007.1 putative aldouronate transport system substrate-binding protein [Paenibacillus eucommiae]
MKYTWDKKVMWKKSLIGFMVCILFVSIAACSAKTNEPKSSEPPASSPSSTGEAGTGGEKQTPVKLVAINPYASFERKTEVEKHVHDIIQNKTGVDLNIVFSPTAADYTQKTNLMLSSGDQLDIIPSIGMDQAIELYKNGAIIPLDDLIDQYGTNLKANFTPEVWSEVTADGKIIGIPSLATNTTGNVLQIRTDWLKELNLEKPVTIEDFEKVLEAFKQNKKDAYPLIGVFNFQNLLNGFAPYFLPQAFEWWQDEQGQLLPPELHPGYKDLMAKMIEWNKKGYIWPEMILSTPTKQIELIAQNKVGAVSGWYSSTIAGATEVLIKTIPEANYDPIILQGNGINKIPEAPEVQSITVITKKSKNPDSAVKFLDYHASREGYALTYVGIEGESYTKLTDGTLEYIGEDKYDANKASYYALYWMFQMDWDDFPIWPMSSWMDRKYSEMKKKTQVLPSFKAIDQKVRYDRSQWKSFAKLTDLETFLDEQKIKVFAGELPLSDWDKIMQQWLDIGGKQMIEDRNAQFKTPQ